MTSQAKARILERSSEHASKPTQPTNSRHKLAASLALVVPLVFLLIFYVTPLAQLFRVGIRSSQTDTYSSEYYQEVWTNPYYVEALFRTVGMALTVTVACLVFGYLCAYYLSRSRSRALRTTLIILVLSPLLTSVIVRTYGWLVLLAPNGGFASLLGGLMGGSSPQLLYTYTAAVVSIVHILMPFAILPLSAGIGRVERNLETASISLGASRVRTFWRVVLPLTIPSIAVATAIVFVLAMGIYVTPLIVGGATMPFTGIQVYYGVFQLSDYSVASALGFSLMGLSLVCVAVLLAGLALLQKKVGNNA